MTVINDLTT